LLSHGLLGAPLGSHWLSGPGPLSGQGMVYLGLFALLAVVTWVATRISRNAAARQAAQAPAPARPGQPAQPGTARPGTTQPGGAVGMLLRVIPYATVAIAAVVPLATGLYLLTTTAWAAAERAVITRRMSPGRPSPGRREARPQSRSA
jgi:YidC/Oxa1 family membrane protein insertase